MNKEQNVSINSKGIEVKGNKFSYDFPAHSFTQFKIKIK